MKKRHKDESKIEKIAWAEEIPKEELKDFVEKERERLMKMSDISISINTYNDIFSDFDPRPYSERALSDDFLLEAKKASLVRHNESLELKFLVPLKKRNRPEESIIKKRLKEHFKKHFNLMQEEVRSVVKRGILFIAIGIILMILATSVLFYYQNKTFLTNFFIILMEPAGWFFFWEGLWQIIFEAKTRKPNYDFYRKMTQSKITFNSY